MSNNNTPVIISFYTNNWKYRELAERMREDCQRLGLNHDIVLLEGSGDWLHNTRLKAGFITDMLDKYKHIVWVDVDSKIEKLPILFFHQYRPLLLRPHSTVKGRLWHVSVMGITRTPQTVSLCHDWKVKIAGLKEVTDEFCFDLVIREHMDIPVQHLPAEYMLLPHERKTDSIISVGLSQDPSKLQRKYSEKK